MRIFRIRPEYLLRIRIIRGSKSAFAVVAVAVMLTACGGGASRWMKPGVSAAQLAHDTDQCELRSQQLAMNKASQNKQILGTTTIDVGGGTTIQTSTAPSFSFADQSGEFDRCMRGRGYQRQ